MANPYNCNHVVSWVRNPDTLLYSLLDQYPWERSEAPYPQLIVLQLFHKNDFDIK